jgi:hypothetical protein
MTSRNEFYQASLSETSSPRQAAYHSIVLPYVCGDARLSRSHLGAVPRLVAIPCTTSDNGHYVTHGRRWREEGVIDRWEWPRGRSGEGDTGKTDYRNPAFPDSPRLGRKNCNLLILLLLFYAWSYDRASCINGKSGAELPSTPEGSCPPLNLMGCGILRKPRRLRHDLLEDKGYSDARGVPL